MCWVDLYETQADGINGAIFALAWKLSIAMGARSAQGKPGLAGKPAAVVGFAGDSLEDRLLMRTAERKISVDWRVKVDMSVQRVRVPKCRWKRLKRSVPKMKARMDVKDLVQA